MVKALCIFIVVMAVLVSLTGTTFSLTGFLTSFSTDIELLEFETIYLPSFPSYTPSQDSDALQRIAYFFTDYIPSLASFIGIFFAETSKIIYYPLVNAFRITQWLFNLF